MAVLKVNRRDDYAEVNSKIDRLMKMQHLWEASKDINDWDFEMLPPPPGSPPTLHHLFEGRCKKTGASAVMKVDEADLRKWNGSVERENESLITQFAEALAWLEDVLAQGRLLRMQHELQQKGIHLPSGSGENHIAAAARAALLRGDHPNLYG